MKVLIKRYDNIFFLFCFIVIYFGCNTSEIKEASNSNITIVKVDTIKRFLVIKVGELRFRRSYADRQFREMSDKEYEKLKQSNPWGYDNYDTSLLKKIQAFGLVDKNYDLELRKFKSAKKIDFEHPTIEFELWDSIQNKLVCKLIRKEGDSKYNLSVSDSSLNSTIELDGFYMEGLKFMLLNIIPGGYKEIVILNDYYIMNGDNSDIFIYEITNAN